MATFTREIDDSQTEEFLLDVFANHDGNIIGISYNSISELSDIVGNQFDVFYKNKHKERELLKIQEEFSKTVVLTELKIK